MKKIMGLLMIGAMIFATGCSMEAPEDSLAEEAEYTEQIKTQSLDAVGLPDVTNFFEMSQLKEIYELRDNPELIMHWYIWSDFQAGWVYQGMCAGYGIPYGASITNPEMSEWRRNYGYVTLPQAEPNGIYTNNVTSSATWVLAIGDDGEIYPAYIESTIGVFADKLPIEQCIQERLPADY